MKDNYMIFNSERVMKDGLTDNDKEKLDSLLYDLEAIYCDIIRLQNKYQNTPQFNLDSIDSYAFILKAINLLEPYTTRFSKSEDERSLDITKYLKLREEVQEFIKNRR